MRLQTLALALSVVALTGGCAHDSTRTASADEFITIEPIDVTARDRVTRFADANRDGYVTRDEARADPALADILGHYDVDMDGKLDRAEFARLELGTRGSREQPACADGKWQTEPRPGGYFGPCYRGR